MMTRISIVMACAALMAGCLSADPRLLGSWKSDAHRSMQWNREHAALSPRQDQALSQLFGHMTVEFGPRGKGSVAQESYTLTVGTNSHVMPAFTNAFRYRIAKRLGGEIVVESSGGFVEKDTTTIHFEGPTRYWLRFDDTNPASLREYFEKMN